MDGFKWIGQNREQISARACRGSGGIGFLINKDFLKEYEVSVVDATYEGILWIKLSEKKNDENELLVCGVYVRPSGSSRGGNHEELFNKLVADLYMYASEIPYIIAGDFNARIGTRDDLPMGHSFTIPERKCIDEKLKDSDSLIQFTKDSNSCIVNGRLNEDEDNWTFVSNRGNSVVDYMIVAVEDYSRVKKFRVIPTTRAMKESGVLSSSSTKWPDHSLLQMEFEISAFNEVIGLTERSLGSAKTDIQSGKTIKRKYKTDVLPEALLKMTKYNMHSQTQ